MMNTFQPTLKVQNTRVRDQPPQYQAQYQQYSYHNDLSQQWSQDQQLCSHHQQIQMDTHSIQQKRPQQQQQQLQGTRTPQGYLRVNGQSTLYVENNHTHNPLIHQASLPLQNDGTVEYFMRQQIPNQQRAGKHVYHHQRSLSPNIIITRPQNNQIESYSGQINIPQSTSPFISRANNTRYQNYNSQGSFENTGRMQKGLFDSYLDGDPSQRLVQQHNMIINNTNLTQGKKRGRSTQRMIQSVDFNNLKPSWQSNQFTVNHPPRNEFLTRDLSPMPVYSHLSLSQAKSQNTRHTKDSLEIFVGGGSATAGLTQDHQLIDDLNDIIVTESDVSHQSSFYDIPQERKQRLNQNGNAKVPKQVYYNQKIQRGQQATLNQLINQLKEEKSKPIVVVQKQNIVIENRSSLPTVKSSPRALKIKQPLQAQSSSLVVQKQPSQKEGKRLETIQEQLHTIISTPIVQVDQTELLTLRHTVGILQNENLELKTELEAFKLFSKGIMKQNKVFREEVSSFRILQSKVNFYKEYCLFMEKECQKLKVQNYQLLEKLQRSISFVLDAAMSEDKNVEEIDQLTDMLIRENASLRELLQVNQTLQWEKIEEELKQAESEYYTQLEVECQPVSDIGSMISKASQEIKQKAQIRKQHEEEELMAITSSLTLDGAPEQFPFKNIKPKKAYLLGGSGPSPSANDTEGSKNGDDENPSADQQ
ncbi:hypothetical protein FGO68_gene5248 [Halteria grandinella]|uniref:Uncharacterized protein n=1 Tax=Halteria grandinella TaxID=5974 RepID=A0A8J8NUB2_HALGN|nr:hypothetical protein FGO68_gene5248 [Halteria grandinella]